MNPRGDLHLPAAIRRLSASAASLEGLMREVPPAQSGWKPAPEQWSVLEVACHLLDEEREDFRRRLALLLEDPERPWPAIDPQGWPRSRRYLERELEQVVTEFLAERRRSLAWLETLRGVDWQLRYHHPQAGPLRAGDLLAAWQAHDLLHQRQLVRLHYRFLERQAAPFILDYAGGW